MKRSGFSHLTVKNYQSIREADVPLGPLTVVVGDNDAGKSALLRAIRAACFNDTGVGFITHGADKTQVTLVLSSEGYNTHLLRWRKKREGSATYDLYDIDSNGEAHTEDGQHFSKLGSSVPPEIQAALRIAEIEVDKTLSITPQVHRQGEYAFLIDKSEGQAARALAKMTKLDVVVEAQGLIRTDFKRAKQSLSNEKALIESLEGQMQEFDGLDSELDLLASVGTHVGFMDNRQIQLRHWKTLLTSYIVARKEYEEIGDLPDIPNWGECLRAIQGQRLVLQRYIDKQAIAATVPDILPDIPDWGTELARLQEMKTCFQACKTADSELVNILEEEEQVDKVYGYLMEEWNAQDVCSACGQPLEKYMKGLT